MQNLYITRGGGFVAGNVNTFADLPDPTTNNNKMYYVKTGTGGFLFFYKYPAGFYISNGVSWNKAEIQTKVSEDSMTLINITNWTQFIDANIDATIPTTAILPISNLSSAFIAAILK